MYTSARITLPQFPKNSNYVIGYIRHHDTIHLVEKINSNITHIMVVHTDRLGVKGSCYSSPLDAYTKSEGRMYNQMVNVHSKISPKIFPGEVYSICVLPRNPMLTILE